MAHSASRPDPGPVASENADPKALGNTSGAGLPESLPWPTFLTAQAQTPTPFLLAETPSLYPLGSLVLLYFSLGAWSSPHLPDLGSLGTPSHPSLSPGTPPYSLPLTLASSGAPSPPEQITDSKED